jgi:hypothetical protein
MNLKKIGKILTSKSVGTGPSSYEKRIYRAAVSQRLRNSGLESVTLYFYVQDGQLFPQPQPVPRRENCLDYDKQYSEIL